MARKKYKILEIFTNIEKLHRSALTNVQNRLKTTLGSAKIRIKNTMSF